MRKTAVCISGFNEYENRIKLVMECMQELGYACTFITSDFAHMQKKHYTFSAPNCVQIPTRPYYKNLSVDRLLSHHLFARDAFAMAEKLDPDLLFVMVPPNSVAAQAAKYKKKHPKVRLVMDIFDMWPETFPSSRAKKLLAFPFKKWAQLRNRAVAAADIVTTECTLYQDVLRAYCSPEKLQTLYLAKKEMPLEQHLHMPEDAISLCYLGSINNIIDIPCIAQIIRSIDMPVHLHIIGDGERRQELIDAAESAGAQVTYHGKLYDLQEKQAVFDSCHFGLNVMKQSVYVGLTMKSIDYFLGGLPIINTIKGDTWQLVQTQGVGVNYTPGEKLDTAAMLQMQASRQGVQQFFVENFSHDEFRRRIRNILQLLDR